ncbi:MAG: ribosome maturation factor RimM [bacterium]|nr:ribosome maturation factor RimM [bacterium]
MAKEKYLECGKAVSTHGVRGTLRFECYCDTPETLARLRTLYKKEKDGTFTPMKVRAASVQKQMVLVSFADLSSVEEAIPYKGTTFYADRADIKLGKDSVFIADILGLDVLDFETREKFGTLADVITPGGREVYVIDDVNGGQFMIPAVGEFVKKIIDDGKDSGIYVKLIDGMREE